MSRESDVLTVPQAARYLQLGVVTTYANLRSGKLPGIKVGGQWRIHRSALERMLLVGPSVTQPLTAKGGCEPACNNDPLAGVIGIQN